MKYTSFGSLSPKTSAPKLGTHLHTSPMALKKTVPQKKRKIRSISRTPPSVPEDPEKFITHEAERLFHESLYNRTFVPKRGVLTSNVYFMIMIEYRGWTKLCEHFPLGIAHVVKEFHSNLLFWEGSTMYAPRKWVNFDAASINKAYNLRNNDSKEYQALFKNTNYEMMMIALTKGRCEWKLHPSTFEVTTFLMDALRLVPKAWYNFFL